MTIEKSKKLWLVAVFLVGLAGDRGFGQRLVSTSPELTELLFQLGRGKDIVATSQFSSDPPEAAKIPPIGPFFMPSIERTAELAPDWVLLDTANFNAAYAVGLKALHQSSLTLDLSRVNQLFSESRRFLSTVYGETESAGLIAAEHCWQSLPRVPAARKFLIFVWLSPPIVAGGPTFLSDLLSRIGGENAVASLLDLPYPQVSEDWLALNPVDVFYYLSEDSGTDAIAATMAEKWWPGRKVRPVRLSAGFFARASLTPFSHLQEMLPPNSLTLPEACHALVP